MLKSPLSALRIVAEMMSKTCGVPFSSRGALPGLASVKSHLPGGLLSASGSLLFVGGRSVESGDGDFVEAEVDTELAAVVDEVVEEHGAVEDGSGALSDELVAPA